MKFYNITIVTLLMSVNLHGQYITSRIDIASENLDQDQLKVAASVLEAVENEKFNIINIYRTKVLKYDDNKQITKTIKGSNISIEGTPPLVKNKSSLSNDKYFRVYYRKENSKVDLLFSIEIQLEKQSYKINSIKLLKKDQFIDSNKVLTFLNDIVCGRPPIGPPVIGNLIDLDKGIEKKISKRLYFRQDEIHKLNDLHKYSNYRLSLFFTGIPKIFFDTTTIWNYDIISLGIYEKNDELQELTANVGKLKNLKSFDFSFKNTSIPKEIFELENLEIFDIYSENDINLDSSLQYLHKLKNLKILKIHNDISSLPKDINILSNLKEISIVSNKLRSIPNELFELKGLTKLTLSGKYDEVPRELGNLKNLKYLNLRSQNLKTLPKSIGNLYNLSSLWISDSNKLDSLPSEIGQIKEIRVLNFNTIKKLPQINIQLNNISELYIYYSNELSGINNYLGGVKKLRLFECSIDSLPNIFDYAKDIREVAFQGCRKLKVIQSSKNIPINLTTVKINYTNFKKIPFEILQSKKIRIFHFTNSKINRIPLELCNLPLVNEVHLNNNLIEEIPNEILNMKNCRKFFLNENNIVSIDDKLLKYKPNNRMKIFLIGNPIDTNIDSKDSIFKF